MCGMGRAAAEQSPREATTATKIQNMTIAISIGLMFRHVCGIAAPRFGSAAKDRVVTTALVTSMLHYLLRAFTRANHCYRAFTAGTQVFLADGHYFDVPLLGGDGVHEHRFALVANHHDGIAWPERLGLGRGFDLLHDQDLAAFHLFRGAGGYCKQERQSKRERNADSAN
jgi:hypothetical protein